MLGNKSENDIESDKDKLPREVPVFIDQDLKISNSELEMSLKTNMLTEKQQVELGTTEPVKSINLNSKLSRIFQKHLKADDKKPIVEKPAVLEQASPLLTAGQTQSSLIIDANLQGDNIEKQETDIEDTKPIKPESMDENSILHQESEAVHKEREPGISISNSKESDSTQIGLTEIVDTFENDKDSPIFKEANLKSRLSRIFDQHSNLDSEIPLSTNLTNADNSAKEQQVDTSKNSIAQENNQADDLLEPTMAESNSEPTEIGEQDVKEEAAPEELLGHEEHVLVLENEAKPNPSVSEEITETMETIPQPLEENVQHAKVEGIIEALSDHEQAVNEATPEVSSEDNEVKLQDEELETKTGLDIEVNASGDDEIMEEVKDESIHQLAGSESQIEIATSAEEISSLQTALEAETVIQKNEIDIVVSDSVSEMDKDAEKPDELSESNVDDFKMSTVKESESQVGKDIETMVEFESDADEIEQVAHKLHENINEKLQHEEQNKLDDINMPNVNQEEKVEFESDAYESAQVDYSLDEKINENLENAEEAIASNSITDDVFIGAKDDEKYTKSHEFVEKDEQISEIVKDSTVEKLDQILPKAVEINPSNANDNTNSNEQSSIFPKVDLKSRLSRLFDKPLEMESTPAPSQQVDANENQPVASENEDGKHSIFQGLNLKSRLGKVFDKHSNVDSASQPAPIAHEASTNDDNSAEEDNTKTSDLDLPENPIKDSNDDTKQVEQADVLENSIIQDLVPQEGNSDSLENPAESNPEISKTEEISNETQGAESIAVQLNDTEQEDAPEEFVENIVDEATPAVVESQELKNETAIILEETSSQILETAEDAKADIPTLDESNPSMPKEEQVLVENQEFELTPPQNEQDDAPEELVKEINDNVASEIPNEHDEVEPQELVSEELETETSITLEKTSVSEILETAGDAKADIPTLDESNPSMPKEEQVLVENQEFELTPPQNEQDDAPEELVKEINDNVASEIPNEHDEVEPQELVSEKLETETAITLEKISVSDIPETAEDAKADIPTLDESNPGMPKEEEVSVKNQDFESTASQVPENDQEDAPEEVVGNVIDEATPAVSDHNKDIEPTETAIILEEASSQILEIAEDSKTDIPNLDESKPGMPKEGEVIIEKHDFESIAYQHEQDDAPEKLLEVIKDDINPEIPNKDALEAEPRIQELEIETVIECVDSGEAGSQVIETAENFKVENINISEIEVATPEEQISPVVETASLEAENVAQTDELDISISEIESGKKKDTEKSNELSKSNSDDLKMSNAEELENQEDISHEAKAGFESYSKKIEQTLPANINESLENTKEAITGDSVTDDVFIGAQGHESAIADKDEQTIEIIKDTTVKGLYQNLPSSIEAHASSANDIDSNAKSIEQSSIFPKVDLKSRLSRIFDKPLEMESTLAPSQQVDANENQPVVSENEDSKHSIFQGLNLNSRLGKLFDKHSNVDSPSQPAPIAHEASTNDDNSAEEDNTKTSDLDLPENPIQDSNDDTNEVEQNGIVKDVITQDLVPREGNSDSLESSAEPNPEIPKAEEIINETQGAESIAVQLTETEQEDVPEEFVATTVDEAPPAVLKDDNEVEPQELVSEELETETAITLEKTSVSPIPETAEDAKADIPTLDESNPGIAEEEEVLVENQEFESTPPQNELDDASEELVKEINDNIASEIPNEHDEVEPQEIVSEELETETSITLEKTSVSPIPETAEDAKADIPTLDESNPGMSKEEEVSVENQEFESTPPQNELDDAPEELIKEINDNVASEIPNEHDEVEPQELVSEELETETSITLEKTSVSEILETAEDAKADIPTLDESNPGMSKEEEVSVENQEFESTASQVPENNQEDDAPEDVVENIVEEPTLAVSNQNKDIESNPGMSKEEEVIIEKQDFETVASQVPETEQEDLPEEFVKNIVDEATPSVSNDENAVEPQQLSSGGAKTEPVIVPEEVSIPQILETEEDAKDGACPEIQNEDSEVKPRELESEELKTEPMIEVIDSGEEIVSQIIETAKNAKLENIFQLTESVSEIEVANPEGESVSPIVEAAFEATNCLVADDVIIGAKADEKYTKSLDLIEKDVQTIQVVKDSTIEELDQNLQNSIEVDSSNAKEIDSIAKSNDQSAIFSKVDFKSRLSRIFDKPLEMESTPAPSQQVDAHENQPVETDNPNGKHSIFQGLNLKSRLGKLFDRHSNVDSASQPAPITHDASTNDDNYAEKTNLAVPENTINEANDDTKEVEQTDVLENIITPDLVPEEENAHSLENPAESTLDMSKDEVANEYQDAESIAHQVPLKIISESDHVGEYVVESSSNNVEHVVEAVNEATSEVANKDSLVSESQEEPSPVLATASENGTLERSAEIAAESDYTAFKENISSQAAEAEKTKTEVKPVEEVSAEVNNEYLLNEKPETSEYPEEDAPEIFTDHDLLREKLETSRTLDIVASNDETVCPEQKSQIFNSEADINISEAALESLLPEEAEECDQYVEENIENSDDAVARVDDAAKIEPKEKEQALGQVSSNSEPIVPISIQEDLNEIPRHSDSQSTEGFKCLNLETPNPSNDADSNGKFSIFSNVDIKSRLSRIFDKPLEMESTPAPSQQVDANENQPVASENEDGKHSIFQGFNLNSRLGKLFDKHSNVDSATQPAPITHEASTTDDDSAKEINAKTCNFDLQENQIKDSNEDTKQVEQANVFENSIIQDLVPEEENEAKSNPGISKAEEISNETQIAESIANQDPQKFISETNQVKQDVVEASSNKVDDVAEAVNEATLEVANDDSLVMESQEEPSPVLATATENGIVETAAESDNTAIKENIISQAAQSAANNQVGVVENVVEIAEEAAPQIFKGQDGILENSTAVDIVPSNDEIIYQPNESLTDPQGLLVGYKVITTEEGDRKDQDLQVESQDLKTANSVDDLNVDENVSSRAAESATESEVVPGENVVRNTDETGPEFITEEHMQVDLQETRNTTIIEKEEDVSCLLDGAAKVTDFSVEAEAISEVADIASELDFPKSELSSLVLEGGEEAKLSPQQKIIPETEINISEAALESQTPEEAEAEECGQYVEENMENPIQSTEGFKCLNLETPNTSNNADSNGKFSIFPNVDLKSRLSRIFDKPLEMESTPAPSQQVDANENQPVASENEDGKHSIFQGFNLNSRLGKLFDKHSNVDSASQPAPITHDASTNDDKYAEKTNLAVPENTINETNDDTKEVEQTDVLENVTTPDLVPQEENADSLENAAEDTSKDGEVANEHQDAESIAHQAPLKIISESDHVGEYVVESSSNNVEHVVEAVNEATSEIANKDSLVSESQEEPSPVLATASEYGTLEQSVEIAAESDNTAFKENIFPQAPEAEASIQVEPVENVHGVLEEVSAEVNNEYLLDEKLEASASVDIVAPIVGESQEQHSSQALETVLESEISDHSAENAADSEVLTVKENIICQGAQSATMTQAGVLDDIAESSERAYTEIDVELISEVTEIQPENEIVGDGINTSLQERRISKVDEQVSGYVLDSNSYVLEDKQGIIEAEGTESVQGDMKQEASGEISSNLDKNMVETLDEATTDIPTNGNDLEIKSKEEKYVPQGLESGTEINNSSQIIEANQDIETNEETMNDKMAGELVYGGNVDVSVASLLKSSTSVEDLVSQANNLNSSFAEISTASKVFEPSMENNAAAQYENISPAADPVAEIQVNAENAYVFQAHEIAETEFVSTKVSQSLEAITFETEAIAHDQSNEDFNPQCITAEKSSINGQDLENPDIGLKENFSIENDASGSIGKIIVQDDVADKSEEESHPKEETNQESKSQAEDGPKSHIELTSDIEKDVSHKVETCESSGEFVETESNEVGAHEEDAPVSSEIFAKDQLDEQIIQNSTHEDVCEDKALPKIVDDDYVLVQAQDANLQDAEVKIETLECLKGDAVNDESVSSLKNLDKSAETSGTIVSLSNTSEVVSSSISHEKLVNVPTKRNDSAQIVMEHIPGQSIYRKNHTSDSQLQETYLSNSGLELSRNKISRYSIGSRMGKSSLGASLERKSKKFFSKIFGGKKDTPRLEFNENRRSEPSSWAAIGDPDLGTKEDPPLVTEHKQNRTNNRLGLDIQSNQENSRRNTDENNTVQSSHESDESKKADILQTQNLVEANHSEYHDGENADNLSVNADTGNDYEIIPDRIDTSFKDIKMTENNNSQSGSKIPQISTLSPEILDRDEASVFSPTSSSLIFGVSSAVNIRRYMTAAEHDVFERAISPRNKPRPTYRQSEKPSVGSAEKPSVGSDFTRDVLEAVENITLDHFNLLDDLGSSSYFEKGIASKSYDLPPIPKNEYSVGLQEAPSVPKKYHKPSFNIRNSLSLGEKEELRRKTSFKSTKDKKCSIL